MTVAAVVGLFHEATNRAVWANGFGLALAEV